MSKKEQILELKSKGYSINKIAKELGLSKSTVCYWYNDLYRVSICNNHKENNKSLQSLLIKKMSNGRTRLSRKKSDFIRRGESSFSYKDLLDHIGDEPKCYLTGKSIDLLDGNSYHLDHKIPVAKGGSGELSNLGLASKDANMAKGDMSIDEFILLCKTVLEHRGYIVSEIAPSVDKTTPQKPNT